MSAMPSAGFNPLSMLAGPAGGGFAPSSGATSSAYQDIFVNSPFNVGEGSLSNTASKVPNDPYALPSFGGIGNSLEGIIPVAALVLGAWVLITAIKK